MFFQSSAWSKAMLFLRLFRLQNFRHTAKDQIPKYLVEKPAACNTSEVSRLNGTQFFWQHSEGSELPRMRPDSKKIFRAASVWAKNFSGAAFSNSAVNLVSSGDFFSLGRWIAKRNSSSVHGCSSAVGASCTMAKGPTNNPSNMDANSSLVGCCVIVALMVLEAARTAFSTWTHCLDRVLTV